MLIQGRWESLPALKTINAVPVACFGVDLWCHLSLFIVLQRGPSRCGCKAEPAGTNLQVKLPKTQVLKINETLIVLSGVGARSATLVLYVQ
jgi:hypothetical protein